MNLQALRTKNVTLVTMMWGVFSFMLVYGTGFFSDDLAALSLPPKSVNETLNPQGKIATPILQYTHQIFLEAKNLRDINILETTKAAYTLFAFAGLTAFFSCFVSQSWSALGSFMVLFYPSHEASTFWFIGQHLTMSLGFFAWAFYLAYHKKYVWVILFSSIGSFISYGSIPFALAFGWWFKRQQRTKAAISLVIPNVIYIIYYIFISQFLKIGTDRIGNNLSLVGFLKSFVLQMLSSLDANIGPSLLCKLIVCVAQTGIYWLILAVLTAFVVSRFTLCKESYLKQTKSKKSSKQEKNNMTECLLFLFFLSAGMLAISGGFPQTAFNLGNRVSLYTSLPIVWLLISKESKSVSYIFLISLIFLSASIGMSLHWRETKQKQSQAIENLIILKNKKDFKQENFYMTENLRYSSLGPFSHIEIASETWVVEGILRKSGIHAKALPLSRWLKIEGNKIINLKYGSEYIIKKEIPVINLENYKINYVDRLQLSNKINTVPNDKRHWLQIVPQNIVKPVILFSMPKLKIYFF